MSVGTEASPAVESWDTVINSCRPSQVPVNKPPELTRQDAAGATRSTVAAATAAMLPRVGGSTWRTDQGRSSE